MALYEHVFISRQDLTTLQIEDLIKQYSDILKDNGGKVIGHEYWGLRTLAYKINKNRKGHYSLIKSNSPPSAAQEMERLMKLNEDVMRDNILGSISATIILLCDSPHTIAA